MPWADVYDDLHDDAVRASIRRVTVTKVDDSGTQQLVDVEGYEGDAPRKVVRLQAHGESSNPPLGSEGLLLQLGGRSERSFILGLEHKDHRPTGLGAGDKAWYNLVEKVLLQTKGDDLDLSLPGTWTVHSLKKLVLDFGGGVTLTASSDGFAFAGGKVTHNGHDIGATHKHGDSQPGGGTTGVPE